MQGDIRFFTFECILVIYILLSQGVIAEKFIVPSLRNIGKRYTLPKALIGLLIAICVTLPELFICTISFQEHGVKLVEVGVACNLGGVAFSMSCVPAFAYLINYGFFKCGDDDVKLVAISSIEKARLKWHILRDALFVDTSILLYYLQLADGAITFSQVVL